MTDWARRKLQRQSRQRVASMNLTLAGQPVKWTKYSAEQIEFLRAGYQEMSVRELTKAFNAKFGTERTFTQIRSAVTNHGLRSGRTDQDPAHPPPCRSWV